MLYLVVALSCYFVHDLIHAAWAILLKKGGRARWRSFPLSLFDHLNLQRVGLTLFFGYGWSSNQEFLYKNASEFKLGRLAVALVALAGPIIYLLMALSSIFLISHFGMIAFFPVLLQVSLGMTILSLLPILPFDLGRLFFLQLSLSGREMQAKQLITYGQLVIITIYLIEMLSESGLLAIQAIRISPTSLFQEPLMELLLRFFT